MADLLAQDETLKSSVLTLDLFSNNEPTFLKQPYRLPKKTIETKLKKIAKAAELQEPLDEAEADGNSEEDEQEKGAEK